MTKRDFVDRISAATGQAKIHVDQVVDMFLLELAEALSRDGRVELRNFGVFRTVQLESRTGRNPRTGEPAEVPAGRHVRFRAGKRLRELLNS